MDELISRKALIAEYDRVHVGPPGGARALIQNAPAVDAVPVVHGRWVDNAIAFAEKCSVCGKGVYWDNGNYHRYPYCPNCGAKMDGEA